jgi:hypothetical protein
VYRKGNMKVLTLRPQKVFKTLSVAQKHEEMQTKMNLACKVGNLGFSISEMTGCMLED